MKVSKVVSRYPDNKRSTNNNPHLKREDLMSTNYHPIPIVPAQMEPQIEVVMAETAEIPQVWPPKGSGDGRNCSRNPPPQCTTPESGTARDLEMEASCRRMLQTDQASITSANSNILGFQMLDQNIWRPPKFISHIDPSQEVQLLSFEMKSHKPFLTICQYPHNLILHNL